MKRFFQTAKHHVQRLIKLPRSQHIRTLAWQSVAAILLASATIVSIARHDATVASQTDAVQTSSLPSLNHGQAVKLNITTTPEAVLPGVPDAAALETRVAYVSGRIDTERFFDDAQQAGLSDALILKLVEIFGWDIDFALGVQRGDSFAVIHEEKYWMGQKVGDGAILAAEFVNRNTPHYAIGFRDRNGVSTYYDKDGLTKRKDFLRTPIEFSRVSSRFTEKANRFHPILKIWTAHRGVDYAAPAGTPVRATAGGQIIAIGSDGGYGNRIIVRHNTKYGAYTTLYAHLSRYAENPSNPRDRTFRMGSPVEQGQIIGYVGRTGLATGPHLHYEFQINNQHKDPLRLKFYGAPIPAEYRQAFFAQAQPLFAQLGLIVDRHLATNR